MNSAAPRMTSGIGATTFGSSAARAKHGPVALRPSLSAGLPLSCHLQSGEGYMRSCILANRAHQVSRGPLSFFANAARLNVLGAGIAASVTRARNPTSSANSFRERSAPERECAAVAISIRDHIAP